MKFLILLFAALMIAPMAHAKDDKKKKAKETYSAAKDAYRDGINAFLKPKDTNNDRSISIREFLAGESDQEAAKKRFDDANKNGDRSLTKSEIAEMLGLDKELDAARDAYRESRKKKKK